MQFSRKLYFLSYTKWVVELVVAGITVASRKRFDRSFDSKVQEIQACSLFEGLCYLGGHAGLLKTGGLLLAFMMALRRVII